MNFGLITEGVSEQNIIIPIVERYLKNCEASCNPYFPKTLKGKQSETGGWHKVLEICSSDVVEDILIENDYLIIQIDTDQSQTPPFNVSHRIIGSDDTEIDKPNNQLYSDIANALSERIDSEVLNKYKDRIIFAICIHTIECWLLPAVFNDKNRNATQNCLKRLNRAIPKEFKQRPISDKNSPESIRTYGMILSRYRKRNQIKDASQFNYGFQKFIMHLDSIDCENSA